MGEWLAAIEPPVISKDEWAARQLRCKVHLLPYFESVDRITTAACEDYRNARLRDVEVATVKKELTTLRQFVKWAAVRGELCEAVTVASVSKKALGTPNKRRVRVDLSPEQAEMIIAALPDKSRTGLESERSSQWSGTPGFGSRRYGAWSALDTSLRAMTAFASAATSTRTAGSDLSH